MHCCDCVLNTVPEKLEGKVKQRDLAQEEQVRNTTEPVLCFVSDIRLTRTTAHTRRENCSLHFATTLLRSHIRASVHSSSVISHACVAILFAVKQLTVDDAKKATARVF